MTSQPKGPSIRGHDAAPEEEGWAKLYRRTGKRDQALEHLTTATTMYREMDMRFWLEKVEGEMKAI